MPHKIPEDAQRLADRLRLAADEIESAARYGVPIPYLISIDGNQYGGATFSALDGEFDAWVEYSEAAVTNYVHDGSDWSRAEVNVNGLPLSFAVERKAVTA